MKIYVKKKPDNCLKCTCNEWVGDPAELHCHMLSKPANKEILDKECPLIELKQRK